jgi:lycopene cyclase domain-containing protein
MSYSVLALLGVIAAALLDLAVLRTSLLRRRAFWMAYAIMLFFQLIMNGILTGLPVVKYDSDEIVGVRVLNAPVEDFGFGFAMVLTTLTLWVWNGRRTSIAVNVSTASKAMRE